MPYAMFIDTGDDTKKMDQLSLISTGDTGNLLILFRNRMLSEKITDGKY